MEITVAEVENLLHGLHYDAQHPLSEVVLKKQTTTYTGNGSEMASPSLIYGAVSRPYGISTCLYNHDCRHN